MRPTFWLTIRVNKKRIPIPLFIIFPIALVLEILAILPLTICAIWKRQNLPIKIVSKTVLRLGLSRLMLVLMLYGGAFGVRVCDENDRIRVGGRLRDRRLKHFTPIKG
jgi:hypothetical protein